MPAEMKAEAALVHWAARAPRHRHACPWAVFAPRAGAGLRGAGACASRDGDVGGGRPAGSGGCLPRGSGRRARGGRRRRGVCGYGRARGGLGRGSTCRRCAAGTRGQHGHGHGARRKGRAGAGHRGRDGGGAKPGTGGARQRQGLDEPSLDTGRGARTLSADEWECVCVHGVWLHTCAPPPGRARACARALESCVRLVRPSEGE